MTIALNNLAVEPVLIVEIDWGNLGTSVIKYSDKAIPALTAIGGILVAGSVSKRGTIGLSDVSTSCSITLDDTDGSLKTIYDTINIEGSICTVSHYFTGSQSPAITQVLFRGRISSDVIWSEGERTLEINIEEGSKTGLSSDLGYAPEEGAFATLNPSAEGKNWPIVFGTAVKVPAVRITYYDEMKTLEEVTYASTSFDIENGDQLPQTPTVITIKIDGIIFTGTVSGITFTVVTKNDAKYTGIEFDVRDVGDPDIDNPTVAWVTTANNYIKGLYCLVDMGSGDYTVNYCNGQNGKKCFFTQAWAGDTLINEDYDLVEAARWPRTSWGTTYFAYTAGDNLMLEVGKDGWTIKNGAPVIYDHGGDVYICNLYTSTAIIEVWGKRTFYGKTIWAKIPSAYYTKSLDTTIVTDPGTITRHVTTLTFDVPLSDITCEGWTDEVYVTLTSTLSNVPRTIVDWVITNFTTYTFSSILSDNPTVTMNFAYFQTTDAIEFLKLLVWQAASALLIKDGVVTIRQLAKTPGTGVAPVYDLTPSLVIMKTLLLGTKTTEDINTKVIANYVTDYSGEDSASHEYIARENDSVFGIQEKTYDMFALTCSVAVEAVADFWSYREGNSWKTLKCQCFINISDFQVFDLVNIRLTDFIADNTKGIITSAEHNTDTPNVSIEVEFAIKSGEDTADPDYWTLGTATCVTPTGSEEDYTPSQDDSCPVYSTNQQAYSKPFHVAIVQAPAWIKRGDPYTIVLNVHDSDHVLRVDASRVDVKIYTSSPNDSFYDSKKSNIVLNFAAGELTITTQTKRALFWGTLRVFVTPYNKQITGGEVNLEREAHL